MMKNMIIKIMLDVIIMVGKTASNGKFSDKYVSIRGLSRGLKR